MTSLPLQPRLKDYNGSNERMRREVAEYNAMAQRVVRHLNTLIAKDPRDIQAYDFDTIARELNLDTNEVASAIMYGGHNGITVGVGDSDRQKLTRFLSGT
jgi:hypothetical protein